VTIIVISASVVTLSFKGVQYYHQLQARIELERLASWVQYLRLMANHTCGISVDKGNNQLIAAPFPSCAADSLQAKTLQNHFTISQPIVMSPQMPWSITQKGFVFPEGHESIQLRLGDYTIIIDGATGGWRYAGS
jgi:hypothetical protein